MKTQNYLYALGAALVVSVVLSYMRKRGASAQKVGDKLDRAGDKLQDTLASRGSAGKVGQKIDKLVQDVQEIAS